MAEPQPSRVTAGSDAAVADENPVARAASKDDAKAAAALSSLDARGDEAEGTSSTANAAALAGVLKDLKVREGGSDSVNAKDKAGAAATAPAKKIKIDPKDVALVVEQCDMNKSKATDLLRKYEGDAVKALTAWVKNEAEYLKAAMVEENGRGGRINQAITDFQAMYREFFVNSGMFYEQLPDSEMSPVSEFEDAVLMWEAVPFKNSMFLRGFVWGKDPHEAGALTLLKRRVEWAAEVYLELEREGSQLEGDELVSVMWERLLMVYAAAAETAGAATQSEDPETEAEEEGYHNLETEAWDSDPDWDSDPTITHDDYPPSLVSCFEDQSINFCPEQSGFVLGTEVGMLGGRPVPT